MRKSKPNARRAVTAATGDEPVFVARADRTIAGTVYRRGDVVDVSDLQPTKLAQLVDHRILERMLPEAV